MNYELQESVYKNFLIDESFNQYMMGKYIEEAIMWTSNNMSYDKLKSLNEDVKTKVKDRLKKIWETIKEKLREAVNRIKNFASSRQKFLENNEDVIKKKVVKYQEEFDLYPYADGIKRIGNSRIVEYNFEKVKNFDLEDYSKSVLHDYFKLDLESDKEDLKDKCIDYFRGGNTTKTYTNKQINMSDMYDFCINYKTKITDVLESDERKIDTTYEKAISQLSKVKIEDSPSNEFYLFQNEPVKSYFFNEYMVPMDEAAPNPNQPNPQTKPQPNQPATPGEREKDGTNNTPVRKASQHMADNKMDNANTQHAKDGEMEKEVDNNQEKYDQLSEKIETWCTTATSILSAKKTVCEEIYNTYMKIIEKHVKSYTGQSPDDKEGNTSAKNVTDYNNENLDADAKAALQKQEGIQSVEVRFTSGNDDEQDGNGYALKITKTENNNTTVLYQNAGNLYPSNKDVAYLPFSIHAKHDEKNGGLWKLCRKYKNKDGSITKDRYIYIDGTKGDTDPTASGYDDANSLGKNKPAK